MPQLCFVTTCRGRRAHLEQSLPRLAAQPGTECMVVDYGCPDGTGDWVEANYPQVKVVRSGQRPWFELARARNLGAQASSAPWLCFTDADALVAADFAQVVLPLLQRGHYLRPTPQARDSSGMCICHRDDFEAVGGYDAVLQGWGMEDKDLYFRLRLAGVEAGAFPAGLVEMIAHGGDLRLAHYRNKHTWKNSTMNLVYCRAKWDLMRLHGKDIAEAERTTLYQRISESVLDAQQRGTSVQLRVPVDSQESLSGAVLATSLLYELGAPPRKN